MRTSQTIIALFVACLSVGCPSSSPAQASSTAAQVGSSPAKENPVTPTKSVDNGVEAPPDVAAPPPDAIKTPSGLASKVLRPGTGTAHPGPVDRVSVHYTGWTTDGKRFDSSVVRGSPITFPLNGVIAGWTEGVQLMVEGEKRRFWIPQDLAYKGRPGPPAGMLVFDVELLSIVK